MTAMVPSTFANLVKQELRRVHRVLRAIPAGTCLPNLHEGYEYIFQRAGRRARMSVYGRLISQGVDMGMIDIDMDLERTR